MNVDPNLLMAGGVLMLGWFKTDQSRQLGRIEGQLRSTQQLLMQLVGNTNKRRDD